jgi:hypothetical protein
MRKAKNDQKPAKQRIIERLAEIESWPDKEARLRAEKGMKRSELCRKYGIKEVTFSRSINLITCPSQETVDKIKAAFAAEGIS